MSTEPGRLPIAFPASAAISVLGATSANGTILTHIVLSSTLDWPDALVVMFFMLTLMVSGLGLINAVGFGLPGHEPIRWKDRAMSTKNTKILIVGCYLLPWITLASWAILILGKFV